MAAPALLAPLRLAARLRLNAPLLTGGLLVAALFACALFAPLLAPRDPLEPLIIREGASIARMPYPPGTPGAPLGSDALGRDMLSRLIHGSRFTLLFCGISAGIRLLIGATLGALAGWYRAARGPVSALVAASSAVPSLVFAIMPLLIVNILGSPADSVRAFVIVLGLTGWAETTVRVRAAVEALAAQPFIESAYAIGLRRRQVLLRHVVPNLRDLLLVEAALAMGATLLLLAELAFLGTFVGGVVIAPEAGQALGVETIDAEWGAMLAQGLRERAAGAWLFFAPMLAFVAAIAAFNLLGEGLRRR